MSKRVTASQANLDSVRHVQESAHNIRRNILRMVRGKGDGYVGQGLGAADILAAVYFHALRFDPKKLNWPDRDRFLLSIGHYSIVLFAALVEAGILPEEELVSYGADESRFEMSTCITTPGVEITGGSLGHGLSQAIGIALGARLSGRNFRVFNLLSDGELQEGVTWEAAMAAATYKLGNLIAFVDMNDMQADGKVSRTMSVEPVVEKWRSFGWYAEAVDGNSAEDLVRILDQMKDLDERPKVIVCYTQLGKGVPMIEQRADSHFVRVEAEAWDAVLDEFERGEA